MEIFSPEYYHKFRCIASACPDSCCKEWAVDVDAASAEYYRSLAGDLGDRLRQVLQDTEDGTVMTIENRRCPMWRQDGLCRIQAELGHDALCQTCRDFPRLRHDYGNFMELGLELSCPEAARLILSSDDYTMQVQTSDDSGNADYEPEIMDILHAGRETVLTFLENRHYSTPEILAIILLYAHAVQTQLDGGEVADFDPDHCLDIAKNNVNDGNMQAVFGFFSQLEILTEQWRSRLQSTPTTIDWTQPFRPMMRYFVQRYWLQAVSDYDLVCRVKLAVVACLLVGSMGGDMVSTAQLFSKEIENDPDNIEAILDGAYTSPALTDVNLLSLLLA